MSNKKASGYSFSHLPRDTSLPMRAPKREGKQSFILQHLQQERVFKERVMQLK